MTNLTHKELHMRAKEMRHAIDAMEGALIAWGDFYKLWQGFQSGGVWEDMESSRVEFTLKINGAQLRRLCNAMTVLNTIINSGEYVI